MSFFTTALVIIITLVMIWILYRAFGVTLPSIPGVMGFDNNNHAAFIDMDWSILLLLGIIVLLLFLIVRIRSQSLQSSPIIQNPKHYTFRRGYNHYKVEAYRTPNGPSPSRSSKRRKRQMSKFLTARVPRLLQISPLNIVFFPATLS